jgi:hypothetical protein
MMVQEDLPQPLPQRRATWVAADHHRMPPLREGVGEQPYLRGFARPVDPIQAKEHGYLLKRTFVHRAAL